MTEPAARRSGPSLLEVENLATKFVMHSGILTAVDDVSFGIRRGETFGLVGESGSGKTVTSLSVMRLNPSPPAVTTGRITFEGLSLLSLKEREMRAIRGAKIAMIFQEPMTSLNPSHTVGRQIMEGMQHHLGMSGSAARARAIELLEMVRIPSSAGRIDNYPHEFSGGMRQRVMIAMALACNPSLLIADEPTTALDVTVQAQFLKLLREMIEEFRMALLYISHNLYVVAQTCDRIGVMYAAQLVETADKRDLFAHPRHPYTIGLLKSMPRRGMRKERLESIRGTVCNLMSPPQGCRLHPRCPDAMEICRSIPPKWTSVSPGHHVACHLYG